LPEALRTPDAIAPNVGTPKSYSLYPFDR